MRVISRTTYADICLEYCDCGDRVYASRHRRAPIIHETSGFGAIRRV